MKKKTIKEMNKEFNDSAIGELQFANMQVMYLLSVLDELDSFCGTLEKSVIKNAKERHQLDKLIHAKMLFS